MAARTENAIATEFIEAGKALRESPIVGIAEARQISFEAVAGMLASPRSYSFILATNVPAPSASGKVHAALVATAILKGDREALVALRDAIDNCLLLGAETKGEAN